MITDPLDISDLRRVAAKKAWDAYRKDSDPVGVPMSFYYAVDLVIKESYENIDKMVKSAIRQKLDQLYRSNE